MSASDIFEVTTKMKIGDSILFKHSFEKWRAEQNLPLLSSNTLIDSQSLASSFPLSQSSSYESEPEKVKLLDILKYHEHGCKILKFYENSNKITGDALNFFI